MQHKLKFWGLSGSTSKHVHFSVTFVVGKIKVIAIFFLIHSGVYADGPGAYLFHGVVEQQYLFHVMDHALCLSGGKQKSCDKHIKRGGQVKNNDACFVSPSSMYPLLMSAVLLAARP